MGLAAHNGLLTLQVRDDGFGIAGDPSACESFGIRIMRYRAGLIGANFYVEPGKPRGTIVSCTVLQKEKKDGTA